MQAHADDFGSARRSWWATLGLDSMYVLLGFPLAIASFTVLVTAMSLSIGLIVI